MQHAFSAYSNWLVPGYIMLGRYPFVERGRCQCLDQGQQQLAQILDAGITTFVSLQAELPPQEEMPREGIDGFYAYHETARRLHSGAFFLVMHIARCRLKKSWKAWFNYLRGKYLEDTHELL
jgi:hypothetical protein